MAFDPEAVLRRSMRRTGLIQVIAGGVCSTSGAFLLALHLLRLDRSLRKMPLAGVLVLDLLGLALMALGAFLVLYGLFRAATHNRELMRRLRHEPSRIASFQQVNVNTTVGGQAVRTTSSVHIRGTDGKKWQIMVPGAEVAALLHWLGERTRGT